MAEVAVAAHGPQTHHGRVFAPLAIVVTDMQTVPEEQLIARLDGAKRLASALATRLCVMLRDPELPPDSLLRLGRRLRARCKELGASFIVNDRLDLALALEADGLHLGRRSLPLSLVRAHVGRRLWLSTSCHGLDELAAVAAAEPDAVLLSPIFASPGKGAPLGLAALSVARARLPAEALLVALGGVSSELAAGCLAAGADAVAAIRADLIAALPGLTAAPARHSLEVHLSLVGGESVR